MKYYFPIILIAILISAFAGNVHAQDVKKNVVIHWKGLQQIEGIGNKPVKALTAEGLMNDPALNFTPVYFESFVLPKPFTHCDLRITQTQWETIDSASLQGLTFQLLLSENIEPRVTFGTERGNSRASLSVNTITRDHEGKLQRLTSFVIDIVYMPALSNTRSMKTEKAASQSVLSSGNWYKIQLDKTGVYKFTYADIQAMGVNMSTVKPENIRLFGNGGGMLPEANSAFRYDDLHENPIMVMTSKSGVFAPGDYILFYGTSPDKVYYNSFFGRFEHAKNLYSDYTYYYLNFDGGPGKRITQAPSPSKAANKTSSSFTDFAFFEKDLYNLIKSGKQWVGERLETSDPNAEIPVYNFANPRAGSNATVRYRLIARSTAKSGFTVKINDNVVSSPLFDKYTSENYANSKTEVKTVENTGTIKTAVQYNGSGSDLGWLDWIEMNVPRNLTFTGGQMLVADPATSGPGNVTDFQLNTSVSNTQVWDVSEPCEASSITTNVTGGNTHFLAATDSIRYFVIWDQTALLTPKFTEKVSNQNLHGIDQAQLLIVTNRAFVAQAQRLAAFHHKYDGFDVAVATNEQIFNEFSSGAPDPTAIRDFARMLYNRGGEKRLRYLMLFGDGSFDPKNRISENTNRVLTFQTNESLQLITSYATDDYYGEFDINEGADATGLIDIGIGRLPVNTAAEAEVAVDKILAYTSTTGESFGEWRNRICLVADDQNDNLHFEQAEYNLAPLITKKLPVANMSKVYMDAYKQIISASRERYPDVNKAIGEQIANGVLVFNYTGHGGEVGLADESILSINEINNWSNFNRLPIFVTATCEFSRFDDPTFTSAGEQVFLNPLGGGIALFTTSRLAIAQYNISLNLEFYDTLFVKGTEGYTRFGDAIAYAKNRLSGTPYIRNFVLLGDPCLTLALPKNVVYTTEINGIRTQFFNDTVKPMSTLTLKGIVGDQNGRRLESFNGNVSIKIYGKARTLYTLGNDPDSQVAPFEVQDNMIYQGNATAKNGVFECSFILPKDIEYKAGLGKISYYASGSGLDANGYFENLLIGGAGIEGTDHTGPVIRLAMDDQEFVDGGITGDNPTLYAYLSDESGINTISNGIGHDISASLDGNLASALSLNNYYTASADDFRKGVVKYRYSGLSEGPHSITLKAWDVFNNSSEAVINFEVKKNLQVSITSVTTYPNPFNGPVTTGFKLNIYDTPVEATFEIYDIAGVLVRRIGPQRILVNGNQSVPFEWDGLDGAGNRLRQGIYLMKITADSGVSNTVGATRMLKIR